MRSKGMGGLRRFPSSRRYRSRGTLSRSDGEKSWMDISEVGQICVPLISAGTKGGMRVRGKNKQRGMEGCQSPPSLPVEPQNGAALLPRGRIPSLSQKTEQPQ